MTVTLAACSTYQSKVLESRNLLKQGQLSAALEKLKPLAEDPSDDQLVYLLDYGAALQMAGQYAESNRVFLKADKLAEIEDYHSVSKVTMAALGSEEMIQYKGESYEKILINVYLALNYLMLNQHDDAMVEVRRIDEKVNKIRQDGRKNYEQNPFAQYLAGLIWESDGKFDDAYISYNGAYKLGLRNEFLPGDLIRSAKKSRRMDEYKKWKEKFPDVVENSDWYNGKKGELIIIYQQGWGPEKHFAPNDARFPKLYPTPSLTTSAQVSIDASSADHTSTHSKLVYNVERDVIKTLDNDVGWMIARKVGGIVAKQVMADQIRQKNKALGDLAWIFMRVSDRADLRQWSTLPKTIQLARSWLSAGDHTLTIQGLDSRSMLTADRLDNVKFEIKPGGKTFINWRSLR